jgi:hypothetical protein|tara:strand:+ start:402 stop:629 length:228 start_codon:yes stop_codon:yes gene_type:complete
MKSVKLYVEHNKDNEQYEVIVRIGKFTDKEEAASYASFIYLTSSLDFGQRDFLKDAGLDVTELLNLGNYDNKKLH